MKDDEIFGRRRRRAVRRKMRKAGRKMKREGQRNRGGAERKRKECPAAEGATLAEQAQRAFRGGRGVDGSLTPC
jgi:hypothetical protein